MGTHRIYTINSHLENKYLKGLIYSLILLGVTTLAETLVLTTSKAQAVPVFAGRLGSPRSVSFGGRQ